MTSSSAPTNEVVAKKTVLFVAEAVTLAHFGRMMTLARSLDPSHYRIVFATDPRYLSLEQPFPFDYEPIWTIPIDQFSRALAKGRVVYDVSTLSLYVEEDRQVIAKVKPDLVVGDFRLSLAVSAPLAGVPYAAVVNAYWSPYADVTYPVPDLPFTKIIGLSLGQKLFNGVRPMAFALHARPLNTVRRRYGLTPIGNDLRKAYTWADYTLYADIPELVPTTDLPASHRYLGPILWSTKTALPTWWDQVPDDRPVVFASPGSSGETGLLTLVMDAVSEMPVTLMVATAGRTKVSETPDNVFVADYLPLDAAIKNCDLVICNGGSLTTYQALAEGVPVLGLTTNMDQQLSMQAVQRAGAGLSLRQGSVNIAQFCQATSSLLSDEGYGSAANSVATTLSYYDCHQRFGDIVKELITGQETR
jgi:UDP:flavonoid glycosyltransferase YjiC (YdhE family)